MHYVSILLIALGVSSGASAEETEGRRAPGGWHRLNLQCSNDDVTLMRSAFTKVKDIAYSSTGLDMTSTEATEFAERWTQVYPCVAVDPYVADLRSLRDGAYSSSGLDLTNAQARILAMEWIDKRCQLNFNFLKTFRALYDFAYSSSGLDLPSAEARAYAKQKIESQYYSCPGRFFASHSHPHPLPTPYPPFPTPQPPIPTPHPPIPVPTAQPIPSPVPPSGPAFACARSDEWSRDSAYAQIKSFATSHAGLGESSEDAHYFALAWGQENACSEATAYIRDFAKVKAACDSRLVQNRTESETMALYLIDRRCHRNFDPAPYYDRAFQYASSPSGLGYDAKKAHTYAFVFVTDNYYSCDGRFADGGPDVFPGPVPPPSPVDQPPSPRPTPQPTQLTAKVDTFFKHSTAQAGTLKEGVTKCFLRASSGLRVSILGKEGAHLKIKLLDSIARCPAGALGQVGYLYSPHF